MTEKMFQDRYPLLYHFLDTTYWPGADCPNLLELLHRVIVRAYPDRGKRMVEEFLELAKDVEIADDTIVELFMRETYSPYRIMNEGNVRNILFCLGEYLSYILKTSHRSDDASRS